MRLFMDWIFSLSNTELEQCKQFAEESSKTQREHRSGGTQIRELDRISEDTLRGKVGEVIVKKFFEQNPLSLKDINLDFGVYERGQWDNSDMDINGKKISIKSVKHFSKWLLLESKDILRGDIYDYYILVLIGRNFKSGAIAGFTYKNEIICENPETLKLLQGQPIPGTKTVLDANNHARNKSHLHNSTTSWINLIEEIKNN